MATKSRRRRFSIGFHLLHHAKPYTSLDFTDYIPAIPCADAVSNQLAAIMDADTSTTEKALNAFVWGVRGQFFWNGNKRTSMTLANKILISV